MLPGGLKPHICGKKALLWLINSDGTMPALTISCLLYTSLKNAFIAATR